MADVISPDQLDEFAAGAAAGRWVLAGRGENLLVLPPRPLWGAERVRRRRKEPLGKIAPSAIASALDQHFPEKVFDLKKNTVTAEFSIYHDVRVDPARAAEPPAEKNKGGRPKIIDWDEFWVEVAVLAGLDGIEPAHRAEFHSKIMEFCERRWGDNAPADSTVRNKLAKLYKRVPR